MASLFEEFLQIILLLFFSSFLEDLCWIYIGIGGFFSIQKKHAVNTVSPLLPEVQDEKAPLLSQILCSCQRTQFVLPDGGTFQKLLLNLNDMITLDVGFIMYMRGVEGLAFQVGNPATHIFVLSHDEANLSAVKSIGDR